MASSCGLVDNSIQAAERGATLTRRMLAFARQQTLETGPVDVPALVRGMAELLQSSIGSVVRVDTQFPLQLPLACADANQLELALLNLSVNARDAMPEGGRITISAREAQLGPHEIPGLASGRYVCLSVADTGEGMDERTLARAAEPFFTTKGVGKGTGLGLSMIHGFAEQSGGRLILKSVPGQGTVAELWLPVAQAGGPDKRAPEHGLPLPKTRPLRVLVVDDDPLVLMNTAAMLEDLGHGVQEAVSGPQALHVLGSAEPFDLVVTDQLMPGMNGLQLIAAIEAAYPGLPVILASGLRRTDGARADQSRAPDQAVRPGGSRARHPDAIAGRSSGPGVPAGHCQDGRRFRLTRPLSGDPIVAPSSTDQQRFPPEVWPYCWTGKFC